MIETSIKDTTCALIVGLYIDLSEFVVPRFVGCGYRSVEIPSRNFGFDIFQSIVSTNGRDTYFHHHGLVMIGEGEDSDTVVLLFFEYNRA